MGVLRWYKRDPRAALSGMMELTLEERGAYNTVLDLIYIHDGAIEDNLRLIAAWLHVDVRIWKRIRQRLIHSEKLYTHGGSLRNERADQEVLAALDRHRSAAEAGLASASSRGYGVRKINGMQPTSVERVLELPTTRKKESSSYSGGR
jgi:uncharacterized protein YdaU (DUF1376 family)